MHDGSSPDSLDVAGHLRSSFTIDVYQNNPGTFPAQSLGDRPTEPLASSRDNGNMILPGGLKLLFP